MNLSTIPFFNHGIDKLCTICHLILKDTNGTHSLFSTVEKLESPGPMNVLEVLQSFSNFNFYNGPQMVCKWCYDKTVEVYKFIQMCNKADEIMQHYLKDVESTKTIRDETDIDVKVEEISIAPTRFIIDGREFVEEAENEKISNFDEVGMVNCGTQVKLEESILKEGLEKEEMKTVQDQTDVDIKVEEISISSTRILIDGREFVEETENEKVSKFDEVGMIISAREIKIEEGILKEGMENEETSNNEEIVTVEEIVTDEQEDNSDFDNHRLNKIDAQMPDERMRFNKCKECHLVFSDKKELADHQTEGKCTKPFLSKLCNNFFGTKCNLRSRDQRQSSQRAQISKDLRLNQDRYQPLTDHETDVVCLECQQVFDNDKQLKIHMKRSHKNKFLCDDCGKVFMTKFRLNTHIHVHSNDSHNEVKINAHKCEQCDQRFTQAATLRTHMLIHSGVKPHKCERCDRQFTQVSNLRRHMLIHSGVKAHKCEQCDRQFTLSSSLRRHMLIHNGVKAHKCEQCDRQFTQAAHLRRHMLIHSGVKAHKCEQCDQEFTHAATLRTHMLIHSGVKPHKCEQCDRRFTVVSDLRRHMLIHSGVKAHKCEQCDRRFTNASNLRRHMNCHNGVKAHKCEQCDRRFTVASTLRNHMLIHSGIKAHKCEQCDRRFSLASNLKRHMDTHRGVKAHKCDRRFTESSALRRHMDIHKGVKAHRPCADTV